MGHSGSAPTDAEKGEMILALLMSVLSASASPGSHMGRPLLACLPGCADVLFITLSLTGTHSRLFNERVSDRSTGHFYCSM